jgi:hypothetical protein
VLGLWFKSSIMHSMSSLSFAIHWQTLLGLEHGSSQPCIVELEVGYCVVIVFAEVRNHIDLFTSNVCSMRRTTFYSVWPF